MSASTHDESAAVDKDIPNLSVRRSGMLKIIEVLEGRGPHLVAAPGFGARDPQEQGEREEGSCTGDGAQGRRGSIVVSLEPGSLARMVAFLDRHPEAGLAGSHIRGTDGHTQVSAFRFPSLLGEIENAVSLGPVTWLLRGHAVSLPSPLSDCEVDWISGTSMLIRRSTFETVGFFDEKFFLYFEEVDFCQRARKAGIKSYFVADAPITHIGAASTGMMDETRLMPSYWFESRHRYFRKHHSAAYAAACDLARVLGMLIWHAKERMLGRPGKWRPHLLRDFCAASWKNLRSGF